MQDELAARSAWGNGRSTRKLMLLSVMLLGIGFADRMALAQDAQGTPPSAPSPFTDTAIPPAAAPLTSPAATDAPAPAATPATETQPADTQASDTDATPSAATEPAAAPSTSPATAPSATTAEPAPSQPTGPSGVTTVSPSSIPTVEATTVEETPTSPSDEDEFASDALEAAPAATESGAPQSSGHDLSPWGMYQAADIVVKGVMIGLVFACFVTWTIWLAKTIELGVAKTKLRSGIQKISSAESLTHALQAFEGIRGPASRLVHEAAEEVTRSSRLLDHAGDQGVKERVTSRLSRVEASAQRRMTLGTGVLATIGSTSPFVGLFGTVWGIMNSFIGIAESQTTNLAVVAPGIAEALLATGIGLVAAIPAVIIYNAFARSIAGYKLLLADASAGVERLVSHELDLRKLWQASKPARQASAAE